LKQFKHRPQKLNRSNFQDTTIESSPFARSLVISLTASLPKPPRLAFTANSKGKDAYLRTSLLAFSVSFFIFFILEERL